jgi:hypothetical protein
MVTVTMYEVYAKHRTESDQIYKGFSGQLQIPIGSPSQVERNVTIYPEAVHGPFGHICAPKQKSGATY